MLLSPLQCTGAPHNEEFVPPKSLLLSLKIIMQSFLSYCLQQPLCFYESCEHLRQEKFLLQNLKNTISADNSYVEMIPAMVPSLVLGNILTGREAPTRFSGEYGIALTLSS